MVRGADGVDGADGADSAADADPARNEIPYAQRSCLQSVKLHGISEAWRGFSPYCT